MLNFVATIIIFTLSCLPLLYLGLQQATFIFSLIPLAADCYASQSGLVSTMHSETLNVDCRSY